MRGYGDETRHHWYHIFYHRHRLAKGKTRQKRLLIFLTPFFLFACSQDYSARLPAYLKAEKELRSRVTPEQGLEDSLGLLAKKFNINPEKELAGLKGRPQAWLSLFNDILGRDARDKNSGKHEKK